MRKYFKVTPSSRAARWTLQVRRISGAPTFVLIGQEFDRSIKSESEADSRSRDDDREMLIRSNDRVQTSSMPVV